jgi:hypothetical protein
MRAFLLAMRDMGMGSEKALPQRRNSGFKSNQPTSQPISAVQAFTM